MTTTEAPTVPQDDEQTTETPQAPEAVTDPAETPETPEAQPTDKAGKDAARYRRQLRETETERDGLRSQVETMQRAEVARILETSGARIKPEGFWAGGVNMADLLTEDGSIDVGQVRVALATATELFGLTVPRAPSADGQGNVGGSVHDGAPSVTWSDALRSGTQ